MDKHVLRFMEHTIVNFSKAIRENNPALTWAVLENLRDVLDSYITKSWSDYQATIQLQNPNNKSKRKANING